MKVKTLSHEIISLSLSIQGLAVRSKRYCPWVLKFSSSLSLSLCLLLKRLASASPDLDLDSYIDMAMSWHECQRKNGESTSCVEMRDRNFSTAAVIVCNVRVETLNHDPSPPPPLSASCWRDWTRNGTGISRLTTQARAVGTGASLHCRRVPTLGDSVTPAASGAPCPDISMPRICHRRGNVYIHFKPALEKTHADKQLH